MKFEELKLRAELLKSVAQMGFTDTTEIQSKCIPTILDGKDIVGQSNTGSGKTAAFGLPILNSVAQGKGIQAIILTPTRELCVQIHEQMKIMGKFTGLRLASVYGGVGIGPQFDELKRAEIVIGTPGRIMDHMERGSLKLDHIKFFVLDEADRMLEMGFVDDILMILKHTPKNRQSLMFSATMPGPIKAIIQKHFNNPVHIKGQVHVDTSLLKQVYYNIRPEEKFSLLLYFLKKDENISLVFCATRQEVDVVTRNLAREGIKAMAIHGGLTQNKRLQVVEMLKKEHITVLVATDVAARGLDIKNVTHVFNYDVPKNSDEYTHRVGRTARAGEKGEAVTLLTQKDYNNFSSVLSDRTIKVVKGELPKFPIIKFERNGPRERYDSRPQGGFRGGGRGGNSRGQGRSSEGRSFGRSENSEGGEERPARHHQGRNNTNRSGSRGGGFQTRR
jgi:ATP-dependent RNA helicase DeaD